MTILAFIFWVVIALFASGIFTHRKDTKPKNNVHFYIARDMNSELLLYMSKPFRGIDRFHSHINGCIITNEDDFSNFGLNKDDYSNLKWEDEPVEVFINLED